MSNHATAKFGVLFLENYEAFTELLTITELKVLSACFKALNYGNVINVTQKGIAKNIGHKGTAHVSQAFKSLRDQKILIENPNFPGFTFINPNLIACGDLATFLARNAEEEKNGWRMLPNSKPQILATTCPLDSAPHPISITDPAKVPDVKKQNAKARAAQRVAMARKALEDAEKAAIAAEMGEEQQPETPSNNRAKKAA